MWVRSRSGRRLHATTMIDHGRFMRRQYRGLRTSAAVLISFLVAWFPYCLFVATIYTLIAVDIVCPIHVCYDYLSTEKVLSNVRNYCWW